jgi:hypothetical protein
MRDYEYCAFYLTVDLHNQFNSCARVIHIATLLYVLSVVIVAALCSSYLNLSV